MSYDFIFCPFYLFIYLDSSVKKKKNDGEEEGKKKKYNVQKTTVSDRSFLSWGCLVLLLLLLYVKKLLVELHLCLNSIAQGSVNRAVARVQHDGDAV